NDRPYGLKCAAFQTEIALERFTFEKGENARRRPAPPRVLSFAKIKPPTIPATKYSGNVFLSKKCLALNLL
ncbi:hypothetical protein, partial [uncultured Desulfovibrio sp.]|uniref:hypothetical protein n=1 Tax=uncultured Desulfovibrio sp. TaxID=167968 RepID=UPI00260E8C5D